MTTIELERTYLARYLPEDMDKFPFVDLVDIYLPVTSPHPKLRIRKRGEIYEATKKTVIDQGDRSQMTEQTIPLDSQEFEALSHVHGKRIHKQRHIYPYQKYTAEIDVFLEDLAGLVLIDFEFATIQELKAFKIPDFCLVEVTQEKFLAGGVLCGRSFEQIVPLLKQFNYQRLS